MRQEVAIRSGNFFAKAIANQIYRFNRIAWGALLRQFLMPLMFYVHVTR